MIRVKEIIFLISMLQICTIKVNGQSAAFELDTDSPCIGQSISITNSSTGATSYSWDFCAGELGVSPGITSLTSIAGTNLTDLAVSNDGGNWYGYITDRSTSSLTRLSFGDSLSGAPQTNNIGNPGGFLGSADKIVLHQEEGNWYGIVSNDFGSSNLVLLSFGSSLANNPSATDLGNFDNKLSRPRGLSLNYDGDDIVLVVINRGDNTVAVLNFGSSITNTVQPEDVLKSGAITDSDKTLDCSIVRIGDEWYGFTVSIGNGNVHRLDFGTSLFSIPTFSTETLSGISDLYQIEVKHDGEIFRALVYGSSGLYRLDFEEGIDQSPALVDLTGTGIVNVGGVTLLSDTLGFLFNTSTLELNRIDFDNECSSIIKNSEDFEPDVIYYGSSGDNVVSLEATNSDGNISYYSDTVSVGVDTAPDISFSIDESRCISNINNFTSSNISGDITSYQWIFGDDTLDASATAIDTTYQFVSSGEYEITLLVTSSEGCTNFTTENITIYDDPPEPTFDITAPSLCTNSELILDNTTNDTGYEGVISYQWVIAGDTVNQPDTTYTFVTTGEKIISLQSFIPGCSSVITDDTLDIQEGPLVSFDYTNNCFEEAINFTSDITGTGIDGYTWDFDDGGTSEEADTSYQYTSAGAYNVALTVTNVAGCSTTYVEEIVVNDESLVSMTFTEAVENIPVGFNGIDETLNGDSIISWNWDFDGLATSSTQDTSLTFSVPQDYTITLSINTAQGCNEELIEVLSVAESDCPTPSFSVASNLCMDEQLLISNQSVNTESYEWDFCAGELKNIPDAPLLTTISGNLLSDAVYAQNGDGNWFGFLTDRNDSEIKRLNFGDSLNGIPTVTNLGNPNDLLELADKIVIHQESGNWYGIVLMIRVQTI